MLGQGKGMAIPRQVMGSPLAHFLPSRIHASLPPQFLGSWLHGSPAASPPAAAPSPCKPWPQSTLPPSSARLQ